jgi:hypothetical protein
MDAVRSSKASVNCRQSAYCHIPEKDIYRGHHLENFKSQLRFFSLNNFPIFVQKINIVPRLLFCSCVSYAYQADNCAILKMGANTIPETQCI